MLMTTREDRLTVVVVVVEGDASVVVDNDLGESFTQALSLD